MREGIFKMNIGKSYKKKKMFQTITLFMPVVISNSPKCHFYWRWGE